MNILMVFDIFMYSKYGISSLPSLLDNYTRQLENTLEYPEFQLACNEYIRCYINNIKYLVDLYPSTFNGKVSISPETSLDLIQRYNLICSAHDVIKGHVDHFIGDYKDSLTEPEKQFLIQCKDRVLMHKYEIFYELRDKHVLECIRDGVELQYWNFHETSITLAFNNLEIPIPFREKPWLLLATQPELILDTEGSVAHRNSFNIRTLDIHKKRIENWDIERKRPALPQIKLNGVLYKTIDGKIYVDENMMMYPKIPQAPPVNSIESNPTERMLGQRIVDSKMRLDKLLAEAQDQEFKKIDRKFYTWVNTNFSQKLDLETDFSKMYKREPWTLPKNQTKLLPPPSNNSK